MGTQVSVKAGCCTWTSAEVRLCTTLGHGTMRKTHTHPYHSANFQRCKALTGAELFLAALATHGCSLNLSGSSFCNSFVKMQ